MSNRTEGVLPITSPMFPFPFEPSGNIRATKGVVFDIQRGSIHDGPGIRTTVFLKGCPLKCKWCHNPESQARQPQLSFRQEQCMHCGICAEACVHGAHEFANGKHTVDFSKCTAEGHCVAQCPNEALSIYGRTMTVQEVISEVQRDTAYFARSGGGLTISGGEPTVQFDFTVALLRTACEAGIHTCVETCGFAPTARYDQLMPWVDIFLFDYKATGEDAHRTWTGVSNKLILSNLKVLHRRGARILLRCPIIPDVNDCEEHFDGIAALAKELPGLEGIEILPYHDTGTSKYARIGRELPELNTRKPAKDEVQRWRQRLTAAGVQKVI